MKSRRNSDESLQQPWRPTTELRALTGVRALAALWVVLLHNQGILFTLLPVTAQAARPLNSGHLGVDLFFLLSGFVIALSYVDRLGSPSWPELGSYLAQRVGRILPLHLLVIAGFVVLAATTTHRTPRPVPRWSGSRGTWC